MQITYFSDVAWIGDRKTQTEKNMGVTENWASPFTTFYNHFDTRKYKEAYFITIGRNVDTLFVDNLVILHG